MKKDPRTLVAKLCRNPKGRCAEEPAAYEAARVLIQKELVSAGCRVDIQEYDAGGHKGKNIRSRLGPAEGPSIVIGAHYDTVHGTPGADDNASAVAVLLCVAEALAGKKLGIGVELVAFDTEEPPHFQTDTMGSLVYARQARNRGLKIDLAVILEMLGYFDKETWKEKLPPGLRVPHLDRIPDVGNFLAVVGYQGDDRSEGVAEGMQGSLSFPVFAADLPKSNNPADLSDSRNFHACGFKAVMLTDTAILRNPHYHYPSDRPDTLDYARLKETVEAVAEAVLQMEAA